MADNKKMSVAEILAAARKTDAPASASPGGAAAAKTSPPADPPAPPAAAAPAPAAPPETPAAAKPAAKPGGGRLSVAEMLAMARANKGSEPAAPAAPAAPAPAEKPAPEPKPAAAAAKPAPAAPPGERDTASILAAARKKDKPGPITKSEAAARAAAAPVATLEKPKIVAPPLPPKPDYARPKPVVAAKAASADDTRRDFFGASLAAGFWLLGGVSALWTLLTVKFMFPNVLREPPSKFKVGFPDAFPPGQVQEKFKAQYGVWLVNTEYNGQPQIFALKTVCTHLGCTPNWLEAEQKYKCPCHGSGFYKDGINFEGPAPRPLERYAIRIADDGQIEVDKSRTFQEEMGAWSDPASFLTV